MLASIGDYYNDSIKNIITHRNNTILKVGLLDGEDDGLLDRSHNDIEHDILLSRLLGTIDSIVDEKLLYLFNSESLMHGKYNSIFNDKLDSLDNSYNNSLIEGTMSLILEILH